VRACPHRIPGDLAALAVRRLVRRLGVAGLVLVPRRRERRGDLFERLLL